MIAFPGMLIQAAEKAGMKTPQDPDNFSPAEFPHFQVFCLAQLCRPVCFHGEHWGNAKVIAGIPEKKIRSVTLDDLLSAGLSWRN